MWPLGRAVPRAGVRVRVCVYNVPIPGHFPRTLSRCFAGRSDIVEHLQNTPMAIDSTIVGDYHFLFSALSLIFALLLLMTIVLPSWPYHYSYHCSSYSFKFFLQNIGSMANFSSTRLNHLSRIPCHTAPSVSEWLCR